MKIGGFQKFSMLEYPHKLCAIIFTVGCNFRCPYCHNPELVFKTDKKLIDENSVIKFLKSRLGKLDAVCITGGEPFMQKDIKRFVKKTKNLGFLVKLDTNGTYPEKLKELLEENLIDYVAMDIKAPFEKYEKVCCARTELSKIVKSKNILINSSIDYEFRTTVVDGLLNKADIVRIMEEIKGAKAYFLQKFVPSTTLDERYLKKVSFSDEILNELKRNVIVPTYIR